MDAKLILLFVFIGLLILFSSFRKNRRKKILFFGDSITAKGTEPTGYITILKNRLRQHGIDDYELTNAGMDGNKIADLYARIESDVISKSPDVVIIFVGVNDVWYKQKYGTGTDAGTFERLYREVISKLQAANIKIILCTPAVIGEKAIGTNAQDEDLDTYAAIIRSIGNELRLPVCDVRMLFTNHIEVHNVEDVDKGFLTIDGVHLNETGNHLVAEALWEKIEMLLR